MPASLRTTIPSLGQEPSMTGIPLVRQAHLPHRGHPRLCRPGRWPRRRLPVHRCPGARAGPCDQAQAEQVRSSAVCGSASYRSGWLLRVELAQDQQAANTNRSEPTPPEPDRTNEPEPLPNYTNEPAARSSGRPTSESGKTPARAAGRMDRGPSVPDQVGEHAEPQAAAFRVASSAQVEDSLCHDGWSARTN